MEPLYLNLSEYFGSFCLHFHWAFQLCLPTFSLTRRSKFVIDNFRNQIVRAFSGIQTKLRCDYHSCNMQLLKQLRWSHLDYICIPTVQINFILRLIPVPSDNIVSQMIIQSITAPSCCHCVIKQSVQTLSCAYIKLWINLGSLKSTQAVRITLSYALL